MAQPLTPPLLRIPPFPGARPPALVRGAAIPGGAAGDSGEDLAALLKDARVGGTYWGAQPALPPAPYRLIATAADRFEIHPANGDAVRITGPCDPWHLVSGASEVSGDGDQALLVVAALSGVPVRCPAGPLAALSAGDDDALHQILAEQVGRIQYADPFTGEATSAAAAIALCGFWRALIDANRSIDAAVGFGRWKQPTAAPLLWGGRPVVFASDAARATGRKIAVWRARTAPAVLAALEAADIDLVEVEDGFIRSAGLGADCIPPLSIVLDELGIYFDPSRPSALERLLAEGDFDAATLARAARLRELIVDQGISKYAVGGATLRRRNAKPHVLVPGQVEDDRSVLSGGGAVRTNLELLRRVREQRPDAHVIYKPHPDVEAGHRSGAIADQAALALADEIIRDPPITAAITLADEVHVNTSLAGFEALLRGKPVTTYGVPFYAGWGLTRDLGAVPDRRKATRTLDELVAAALLRYPRYLDPVTGLPCPPEILVRRLAEGRSGTTDGLLVGLRRVQGRTRRLASALRFWR
ncbi:capsule biosynthesis protein [Sphingomonas sinipercae]|uniref:Capsule biosynthesis protein n=1 Tax=Sphingomonas sinipercae TaxID=2714944 RepID=A0A6G7ZKH8_9SPHN|nr:capsule biosynthesis protein [Sphingomonas sinipercae]QIL01442.1 capsule biosynthesis protein [Sphingomonas sinipercae]